MLPAERVVSRRPRRGAFAAMLRAMRCSSVVPVASLVLALAVGGCKKPADAGVTGAPDKLLVAGKPAKSAKVGEELVFHVLLSGVTLGTDLSLSCSWKDPSGREVRDNHWTTKPIDHAPWRTHCRFIPDVEAPGEWSVEMFLAGRSMGRETFVVTK